MELSITALMVFPTLVVLLSASVFDWKYREIPDWHWAILFLMGIVLSAIDVIDSDLGLIGSLMPICIVLILVSSLLDIFGIMKI